MKRSIQLHQITITVGVVHFILHILENITLMVKFFLCCKKTPFLVRSWVLGTKKLFLKNLNYKNSIDDNVHICRFLHVSFTQDGTVLYHAISDEKLRKQLKKVQ